VVLAAALAEVLMAVQEGADQVQTQLILVLEILFKPINPETQELTDLGMVVE
jgi:hypothetical protein